VRLRLELFVEDLDTSIGFYAGIGFAVERREHDYASLRWGDVVLGLAPTAKLPMSGAGPGFTQERLAAGRGAGVEIVLEVEDLDVALAAVRAAGHPLAAEPADRPWGLRDFRLTDPDGYYLRITTRGQTPRRN
jgi:catechol 2,3-dioxygenase-like lactoylglutathione lyase family enzyme